MKCILNITVLVQHSAFRLSPKMNHHQIKYVSCLHREVRVLLQHTAEVIKPVHSVDQLSHNEHELSMRIERSG